ncbi:MAG: rhomboid family intramembrane serine protease [Hyphomicrobiaceae bacterium]|nr:rhomboid family intramembrane serine protease [Hyphomicrobiaceae bacterium]
MVFIPISDDNPLRSIRFQWVTLGLVVANVLIYLVGVIGGGDDNPAWVASFALVPSELFHLQGAGDASAPPAPALMVPGWLTLITYQFLHSGALHVLTNMLFLWVFGDNVEDAMGHLKFLVFYLLCGVAAGLAQAAALPSSQYPVVGASGAVAGVIAAYLMLHPKVRVWVLVFRFLPLRVAAGWVLGLWVVTQVAMVVMASVDPGVAWWAHVGGLAAGAVLVLFMRRPGVPLFDRGSASPPII